MVRLTIILSISVLVGFAQAAADDSCKFATPQWSEMTLQTVKLQREDGEVIRIRSRIADSPRERSAGFQHICPEVIQLSSILFVYNTPTNSRFHMLNVHDDLDIGFFGQDRKLIAIVRMTPQKIGDGPAATYGVNSQNFMYALETRADFFTDHNLKPDTTILDFP
ncbi:MAG: DUF192 domain-containing protein [Acidiferrobacterales bacterium]|nr:DUF192 domain-containing protein [Acidiferrobacterales bacterium]